MTLGRKINCPLCFERIAVSQIGFRCEAPSCVGKPTLFRAANSIPLLEKIGLFASPKRYLHSCGDYATARICPKCKQEIPTSVDDLSDMSIAIIGAKDSGKSHYVAMLINWIKRMGSEFGWVLSPLTEDTITRYNKDFYDPLFVHHVQIDTTRAIHDAAHARPLIYSLQLGHGILSRKIMLVFFDAAGENLENERELWYINRYISNASGIICLLDPLQLDRVRDGLIARYGAGSLPVRNGDTGSIINRVERLIRKRKDVSSGKIKIPLAVAFSKMDFVRDAGGNAANVCEELFRETRHRGGFNESEFQNIDGLMRSWVQDVDATADILMQSGSFSKNAFFGFSALGCNPKGNGGRLDHDPRSFRVEDPFLWLLRQRGLVKKMKG